MEISLRKDWCTPDLFLQAVTSGKLYKVQKCFEYSDIRHKTELINEALVQAIVYGRSNVATYLLQNGANVDHETSHVTGLLTRTMSVLALSCRYGHHQICKSLIDNGARITLDAVYQSIEYGYSNCLEVLLNTGKVDIHQDDDNLLVKACRKGNLSVVRLLIRYGADVDAQESQPLSIAVDHNHLDLIDELLSADAEITQCVIKAAAENAQFEVLRRFFDKGVNLSCLEDDDEVSLDTFTKEFIKMYSLERRLTALRNSVKASTNKLDFKWQDLCKRCRQNDLLGELRKEAHFWNLDISPSDDARDICAKFAVNRYQWFDKSRLQPDEYDFIGTPLVDLPAWKILEIDNHHFNCFDLFKWIDQESFTNPYTRAPLPIDEILEYKKFLKKVLTKERYKDADILQLVADTPILSKEAILRDRLLREVWDKLSYPPLPETFLTADDETLDELVNKLYDVTSDSDIYPMLTQSVLDGISESEGYEKKVAIVNMMVSVLTVEDEHSVTRSVTLSILVRRLGPTEDELYQFLTEEDDDDTGGIRLITWYRFPDDDEYGGW